jgi:adenosine deaminase
MDFFEHLYGGLKVLRNEVDFYDVAMAYYKRCAELNIRHSELFVDFQEFEEQGVSLKTVLEGYRRAQLEAEEKLNVCSLNRTGAEKCLC